MEAISSQQPQPGAGAPGQQQLTAEAMQISMAIAELLKKLSQVLPESRPMFIQIHQQLQRAVVDAVQSGQGDTPSGGMQQPPDAGMLGG